jgi:4-amino-4-deoxy-L-arabinose transferase-like glycosyltransferase
MSDAQRQSALIVRRFGGWRAGIIAGALVLHVAYSFLHYSEPAGDAAEYHGLAVSLATTGRYALPADADQPASPTARRMPLYPLFLAATYSAVGPQQGLYGVPVVQALLMVCNVALVIALARRLFGEVTALLAGVLTALYQPFLYLPTELVSENAYIPLLLMCLYLLTWPAQGRRAATVAGFVVLGGLVLTRANALLIVPVAYLWAWRALGGQRRRAAVLLLCTLGWIAPLVPWWARNAAVFHRFVALSTNGGWNFYLGHNEQYRHAPGLGEGTDFAIFDRLLAEGFSEPQADRELYARGVRFLCSHPGESIWNVARKAWAFFSVHTVRTWSFALLLIVLLGLLLAGPMSRGSPARRATGIGLMVAGCALWVSQIWWLRLVGVGISFGALGLAALAGMIIALRSRRDHWLLPAVYLSQTAAALAFIPIARIRWSVDAIAVIYAAVLLAALGNALVWAGRQRFP